MFGRGPSYFDFSQYDSFQPAGLTLEDLYTPRPRPTIPSAPTLPGNFGDLDDEARKALRREAILRAAIALGGQPGQIGQNLALAAASLGDWKRERLDEARHRAGQDYATQVKQAELDANRLELDREDDFNKRKAEGRLAAVRAITERDPEMGSRAEAAALRGDDAELRQIWAEHQRRQALRDRGEDPDDPFADERAKEKIKTEAWLERQRLAKKEGLSTYFDDDLSLEEIQARSAAAARGQRSVWGDRGAGGGSEDEPTLRTSDGKVYEVFRDESGAVRMRPVPGQQEGEGERRVFFDQDTGSPYRVDSRTGQTLPVAPPPRPIPLVMQDIEATLGRKLTVKERTDAQEKYVKGVKPREIVASIQAPQRITNPEKAPTSGVQTKPPAKKSAPPPQALPPGQRPKPKVTERDRAELRAEVEKRYANLSPQEREQKYQQALRLLTGS